MCMDSSLSMGQAFAMGKKQPESQQPDYEGFVLSSRDALKHRGTSCRRKTRQKRPGKFQHCWDQKKMPDRKTRGNLSSTFSTEQHTVLKIL